MAKRFIDTKMFEDEWICSLSKDGKLFFIYYITTCDHAGILKLNKRLCEFQTGLKSIDTVIKELGKSLITVKENVYFMPRFIKFQYPDFPKSTVKQQDSALKILKSYNLFNNETNSYLTLTKELLNSYDSDNVNDSDSVNEYKKKIIKIEDVKNYFLENGYSEIAAQKFYDYYSVADWKDAKGNKVKNWKQKAQAVWFKDENKIVDNSKPKMVW